MSTIASLITSITIVYLIVYSDADQRKHRSPASLAFVRGIHRRPVLFCAMDLTVKRDHSAYGPSQWKTTLYTEGFLSQQRHMSVLHISRDVMHDDVIKWKHFPHYWPFVRGIQRSPVDSPHKGQWRGALILSLICTRINGWVNNREPGDLRRHCAHYDVSVMETFQRCNNNAMAMLWFIS